MGNESVLKYISPSYWREKIETSYLGWKDQLPEVLLVSHESSERLNLFHLFLKDIDELDPKEAKIVHQGLSGLIWLTHAQGTSQLLNAQQELNIARDTLPDNIKGVVNPRFGIAVTNYAVEMITSNFIELGLDAYFATELLKVAATDYELPSNVIALYSAFIAWSANPFPLPSPAGFVRAGIHTTLSTWIINRYNKLSSLIKIPSKSYLPRAIDFLTTVEYTGTVIPILPLLNIADAYGIPLSLNTIKLIYYSNKILKAKNLLEKR